MGILQSIFASSIGKKAVMALTGLVLFGFVVAHLLGNLQVYSGPDALNHYAKLLRVEPPLLWAARLMLAGSVLLHIWAAISLTRMNQLARPVDYRERKNINSTYSSRTMRWGGVIIALFVVYHLMHFTLGVRAVHSDFVEGDVYHNVVSGFQFWPASAFYILAMIALGFHLRHGLWSMLQTLGANHPKYNAVRDAFAILFALVVTLGNISIPVAVLTGLVR